MQTTAHIMMVRPAHFGFNEQTAESNAFQTTDAGQNTKAISEKAIAEFDEMVRRLREQGVHIHVIEDSPTPVKPDAVFPNNWVTFHDNGMVITYPMYTPNRQAEIREDVILDLGKKFNIDRRINFEKYTEQHLFLEGTGSMILDRENRIVYACVSARTEPNLLHEFARWADYTPVLFQSVDAEGLEIYHTNVMMALGETFVVICMDSVKSEEDKTALKAQFAATNKEIIDISFEQVLSFAGNMLQVRNDAGETFLMMSEQAFKSLNKTQIAQIEAHTNILYSPIDTIETYGGGSARCMMAEIFLPVKEG